MHILLISIALIFLTFCSKFTLSTHMYVPTHALRKTDICSVMSIAILQSNDKTWIKRVDHHNSRRTMLYFLFSVRAAPNNEHVLKHIYECFPNFNWKMAENTYLQLKNQIEPYQQQHHAAHLGKYWELKISSNDQYVKDSREYMSRHRLNGFHTNELKIYWNYNEINKLSYNNHFNPKTDTDAHNSLLKSPVYTRKHSGTIRFIKSGIGDAVFSVPKGKQVIVLDFADERMPGGYYIEYANTQEEAILYTSDGYRALLDMKYGIMDGGYMLPEYGVGYIKRVRFFRKHPNEERLTDMIVGACYDLSSSKEGLYIPPAKHDIQQVRSRTREKLLSIIASAVANTEGNGKDTYLLLGPIGTGAFQNDPRMIAELFYEILNNPLMNSNHAIKYAFEQIWFVSKGSLIIFEDVFNKPKF